MTRRRRHLSLVAGIALVVTGSAVAIARPWLQLEIAFFDEHRSIFFVGWILIAAGVSLVVYARTGPGGDDEDRPIS